MDFDELVENYVNSRSVAESTRQAYRNDLRHFRDWCITNDLAPSNAGTLVINRFLAHEQSRGVSTGTRLRRWGTLKRFFEYLVEAGELRKSPMDDPRAASRPQHNRTENTRYMSVDDLRAMIAAARERGPNSFAAVCLMGIHALQPAELTRLRVEHIQQRQGRPVLVIPDRERGTWTPLVLPTISAVEQLSAGRPVDAPLLTNDEGRAMTYSNLRYRVRQAAQAVGLDPVPTPRVLRTTAGALAMSRGIPIGQLQDLLGVEGINHIWKFAEQVKPYHYEHAAEAVAHLVIERGHLIEAERLLLDNDVHPAVAVMTAGAAMEFALREWAREKEVAVPGGERRAKLSTYAGALRGAGELTNTDVQRLAAIMEARDDAAHGWYDRITPEKGQQVIQEIRRILESHNRPAP